MVGLWILIALLGLLAVIALLPITITIRHHQENEAGRLQYVVAIGPVIAVRGTSPIGEVAAGAPKRRNKKKRPLPTFLPQSPLALFDWGLPSLRYFRNRVRFRRLNLFIVVGGMDAFESAMLAGVVWTLAGTLGSVLSFLFHIPLGLYRVTVQPSWQQPMLTLNLDCMLTFRVGHAIWAGVLLAPQALKSARAARRRKSQKGEEARG